MNYAANVKVIMPKARRKAFLRISYKGDKVGQLREITLLSRYKSNNVNWISESPFPSWD